MNKDNNRVAILGIVVNNREETSKKLNDILSDFADIIVGRMGLPYKEKGISVISIIVDGSNDQIGALAGKLGNISGVKAKVAITH
ncbi:iron-only hydrogenase system regulator [Herbivorax sp. ANBcel31]|uniref:TM1266 family iron-only hydrogenase system putative regulator n=1 Tax=Herbivorax sp. ANBcel31 TaxID=3069754 RepID=UPI0027B1B092|nr:TM1266 family iron-only hydrogenase system putative regulator [Herbivorax sp. ANBcel31]MDQ2086171.1 iron-only hydrogenase system regulator [Herbivorax sp. ANBcel31]